MKGNRKVVNYDATCECECAKKKTLDEPLNSTIQVRSGIAWLPLLGLGDNVAVTSQLMHWYAHTYTMSCVQVGRMIYVDMYVWMNADGANVVFAIQLKCAKLCVCNSSKMAS